MRMNVTLRPVEENDRDFLWRLHCAALKPYIALTWGWDEEFQHRYFLEHFTPFGNQVISYADQCVGMLAVDESGREVVLRNIELLPQFQGMGIGSQIISDILERAAQRGAPVSLRVLKVNPARNLYLRLGFSVIGETETHYWMRKEGNPMEFLPDRWETPRCFLTKVGPESAEPLEAIFAENNLLLEQFDLTATAAEVAADIANQRLLPVGGSAWRNGAYLIRELESRATVGWVMLYFGYPTPGTLYVRCLYLRSRSRGIGLGREVLAALEERTLAAGFREARVMVGQKDFGTLRFWTSCGYGHISKLKGDHSYCASPQANVELWKLLAPYPTGFTP